jgi:hypothetical protein
MAIFRDFSLLLRTHWFGVVRTHPRILMVKMMVYRGTVRWRYHHGTNGGCNQSGEGPRQAIQAHGFGRASVMPEVCAGRPAPAIKHADDGHRWRRGRAPIGPTPACTTLPTISPFCASLTSTRSAKTPPKSPSTLNSIAPPEAMTISSSCGHYLEVGLPRVCTQLRLDKVNVLIESERSQCSDSR